MHIQEKSMKAHIGFIPVLFLTSLSLGLSAQTKLAMDSIAPIDYAADSVAMLGYAMAKQHPVWIAKEMKNGFNQNGIRTFYSKGNFIPAQGASQIKAIQVHTEGKTTWNKTHFWGSMEYLRQQEDSTALRHQTGINTDAPIYFGSLRKNYYERDLYNLKAAIQHPFADGKLPITWSVDYRLGSHFSNNDPRGRINDFQLNTALALGHQFGRFSYHLQGSYGYGRERVQVAYKNDKYMKNTSDPLYVNWYMNGFGSAIHQLKDINYNDDFKRYGASLHLAYAQSEDQRFYINAGYKNEVQKFKRYEESPQTYALLNTYTKDGYTFDALWTKRLNSRHAFAVQIEGNVWDGLDLSQDIGKPNYLFRSEYASAKGSYLLNSYTLSGKVAYNYQEKKDGRVKSELSYTHLQPSVELGKAIVLNQQQALQVAVRWAHRFVLDDKFSLGANNAGIFAETILFHDYLYQASAANTFGGSINFLQQKLKKAAWKVGLDVHYTKRSTLPAYTFQATSIPGINRLQSNLHIALFF